MSIRIPLFVSLISCSSFLSFAQVVITEYHPIEDMIARDEATLAIEPASEADDAGNLFDLDDLSAMGGPMIDTARATLVFVEPLDAGVFRQAFTITGGVFSLETADDLADLDAKSGSYQLLADGRSYVAGEVDSIVVEPLTIGAARITAVGASSLTSIGEWSIGVERTYNRLVVVPERPKVLPGTTLKLQAALIDDDYNVAPYPYDDQLSWSAASPNVASFDNEDSRLTGHTTGATVIEVSSATHGLSGSDTASVVDDFVVEKADPIVVKVAAVIEDPYVNSTQRLHARFGWGDPFTYTEEIVEEFLNMTDSVVQYDVVEIIDDSVFFTRIDDSLVTLDELVAYYQEPNWQTLKDKHSEGKLFFDYRAMAQYYDFYRKRQDGEIDEVWVYTHPYAGMAESQLMGKNAFWWNSGPITDVPEWFTELLSVMGWNYERGVDMAIHSCGHRFESAMSRAYGGWDPDSPNPTPWDLYTRIDKEFPGEGHVGNTHYPVNAMADYDVVNTRTVWTRADNWLRYPYLLDEKREVNCGEWQCNELGYQRWFFSHVPRYKGVTDGVLNNWWHYFLDYQEAVALAKVTEPVSVRERVSAPTPTEFRLDQNYPNPFNPSTVVAYTLGADANVRVAIYNALGQEVAVLADDYRGAGVYNATWRPENVASGVYFLRLTAEPLASAPRFDKTIKLVYLK